MKYNAPYGSADPNASYVDRNTPGAVAGSKVPAAAIEMPQREIVTVITNAGLAPSNNDPTQLDQAIDLKINAATGGAGDGNYVLMTQARVRLPIFPEVLTADGRLPILSPSTGQVRVPAGYEFLHRGIFSVTTVQADFATAANKTYHLRWTPDDGFTLKDLADAEYNPGAVAEAAAIFDSGLDDILFARVVTNASNVPTVTNLANKANLRRSVDVAGAPYAFDNDSWRADYSEVIDWARTPDFVALQSFVYVTQASSAVVSGGANRVLSQSFDRYLLKHDVITDWDSRPSGFSNVLSRLTGGMIA